MTLRPDDSPRRVIDMAIGALMALRQCTQREALESIVATAHATGLGLGGVSLALICVVSGRHEDAVADAAVARWRCVLAECEPPTRSRGP